MDASRKEIYQGEEKLLISIDLGTTMSPYTPHARLSIRGLADPFPRCGGIHPFVPRFSTPGQVRAFSSCRTQLQNPFQDRKQVAWTRRSRWRFQGQSYNHTRRTQSQFVVFRFRPWWPMKVIARLRLARMPLSMLEQMVYSLRSGSNSSKHIEHVYYGCL